ncbi:uncharacterized protein [Arachis hypogaea]|uniref:uncharacterized protein n=1 Tax=Arachis hypogaea TaxID=3818 RepID=UPI0007AF60A2
MVAKSVKVIAQTDLIKYMLSFPMLRGRLGKWMLALTEFDLQYVPARAIKGQVIADFLVDNSNNLNGQGANVIDIAGDCWKLYFDGSKHKDGAGVGILIISPKGIPSKFLFELKYPCSNNVAEYETLVLVLEILISKGALEVQILCDSQLVLKIHNEIANELAQIASRYKIGLATLRKLASIHQILVPVDEREVLCMGEWEDNDWRKPIAEYLKNPSIPVERKIKLQAINFVLIADELYKKGIDRSLLRCLGQDDKNIALGEVHEGICGAHQAGKKMKWVLYRNYVYWPTMIKDCIEYAKANGQVEAANKILISLIKKQIRNRPRTWHETLSQVLWAYRNSPRGSTVDDYWNAMFDELNELDSERILALENMIRQKESVARNYNCQIKEKCFSIGELVLKVILPMEKKSRVLGKWSHTWEGPFQVIGLYSENAYRIKDIESGNITTSINGKYLKQYHCLLNQSQNA